MATRQKSPESKQLSMCLSLLIKPIKSAVVKNALKRTTTCNTWEELINEAIINASEEDLFDDIVDKCIPQCSKVASRGLHLYLLAKSQSE